MGISVDNLIGLSADPYAQPTHHRSTSSSSSSSPATYSFYSNTSSPSTSVFHIPSSNVRRHNPSNGVYSQAVGHAPSSSYMHSHFDARSIASNTTSTHTQGVPIPRPSSQVHRPKHLPLSGVDDADAIPNIRNSNMPLSPSPSSASMDSGSPYSFSPVASTSASYVNPASFVSVSTNVTSPPSSASLQMGMAAFAVPQRGLSYPSVPPPSLSSSFGSPTVSFHMPQRDPSLSPIEPLSRRNSVASGPGGRRGSIDRRVAETGNLRNLNHNNSASASRRPSFDRGPLPIGGRVAEMGTLIGRRSRAGSVNQLPATVTEADDMEGLELGVVVDEDEGEEDGDELTRRVILPSVSMKLATAAVGDRKGGDSEIPPAKSR